MAHQASNLVESAVVALAGVAADVTAHGAEWTVCRVQSGKVVVVEVGSGQVLVEQSLCSRHLVLV